VYAQTRAALGFAKPRLFKQAVIPLPNMVCQRSEAAQRAAFKKFFNVIFSCLLLFFLKEK